MPTELTPAELDAIRARNDNHIRCRTNPSRIHTKDIPALLSHADALAAKVSRLEGEHRRRRVDDELPPHGALVVAGHDDGFDPSLVTWNEHREGWEGQNGSFRRRSGFDWWAPIAPEEE